MGRFASPKCGFKKGTYHSRAIEIELASSRHLRFLADVFILEKEGGPVRVGSLTILHAMRERVDHLGSQHHTRDSSDETAAIDDGRQLSRRLLLLDEWTEGRRHGHRVESKEDTHVSIDLIEAKYCENETSRLHSSLSCTHHCF